MWKKGKVLIACMFTLVWWSVFYPELCFAEGTCEAVLTAETEETDGQAGILQAKEDEIVISSRLLEWCEERLFDRKE